MKTELLRRARRHFNSDFVSREVNRANQRAWVRCIRMLGNDWIMLKRVEKPAEAV